VKEAILHNDKNLYETHVCCIMPNHLHWIFTPLRKNDTTQKESLLIPIVQAFKSFTSHAANKILQRSGAFWSREYYDHLIRNSEQFSKLVAYSIENPVKARLCSQWEHWPWTIWTQTILDAFHGK
jgi:REP-associated tyrosine transposase